MYENSHLFSLIKTSGKAVLLSDGYTIRSMHNELVTLKGKFDSSSFETFNVRLAELITADKQP